MPQWIKLASCNAVIFLVLVAAAARAQDKVRIGLSSVSATSGSIWVAEEKGLFKKHGIDVEVIIIGGGAARVVSSLISGEIQFSVGGGDAVILALASRIWLTALEILAGIIVLAVPGTHSA